MLSRVSLQSYKFCDSQDQDRPPENIARRRREDVERGRPKASRILAVQMSLQVSKTPGEDRPERLQCKRLCEFMPLEERVVPTSKAERNL